MSKGAVTLSEAQQRLLARVVKKRGARSVCDAAGLRTEQSIFRALSGAPVLPLTRAALQRACEELEDGADREGLQGGDVS
jgi:hypothetical protein